MDISTGLIQKAVSAAVAATGDRIEEHASKAREVFSRRVENKIARLEALPKIVGGLFEKTKKAASTVEKRLGYQIRQAVKPMAHELMMKVDDDYRNEKLGEEFIANFDKRKSVGV